VSFVPPCPPAVVNAVRAALDVFQLYRAQIEKGSLIPLQPVLREYAVALGGLDRRLVEMGLDWLVGGGYVTRTWKRVGTERVLPGGRTEFVGPVSVEAVLTPTPALWQLVESWPCSQNPSEAENQTKLALDAPEPQAGEQPEYIFRRDGDGWFVRAFGVEGHFKASRGFECLARLLAQSGVSAPLAYLAAEDSGAALKFATTGQVAETVIDKEALKQYHDKIKDYNAGIERALRDGREGDAEHLRAEREHLIDHIAEVTGLGGKLRHNKSEQGKIRDQIRKALDRAYKALRQAKPPLNDLADHLQAFIQPTDEGFIYNPAPPIDWRT